MLKDDTLTRIRLTRRAAEAVSTAGATLGPAVRSPHSTRRLESSIRAAMALCREVGGPEALRELARLEVVLRELHGEPAARLH
jgi:hypothetical protein